MTGRQKSEEMRDIDSETRISLCRAPVESIKAFLSSGPTTTSQKSQHYVNIHITSSQSALYTFPVEVSRSETTVHHQVSSPSMMPCAGAQPVSTLHFERTEVVVLSSDKTAVGIMYGQDSLIQVATPAVLELGKVLGEWNGDKDRVLATKLSDPCGSNLTVVLNNSRSYRMDLHQNPRSRLLRQALVAIEKRLPRDIVHHMRELVLGSQARSPSEISLVLEGVSGVVAPRTVIASENLSADASDELAAFLRSCDEPDLRKAASTIARKENPAESTVEGNLHPAGAFALLSILHLIAQDCLLDTGRNADVVVLVPVVCRLAENLGLSAWRDFWWRLFPKLSLIESKPCEFLMTLRICRPVTDLVWPLLKLRRYPTRRKTFRRLPTSSICSPSYSRVAISRHGKLWEIWMPSQLSRISIA